MRSPALLASDNRIAKVKVYIASAIDDAAREIDGLTFLEVSKALGDLFVRWVEKGIEKETR